VIEGRMVCVAFCDFESRERLGFLSFLNVAWLCRRDVQAREMLCDVCCVMICEWLGG